MSGGGALGGLFVGVLAPLWFDGYYELRIGLGLAALLFLAATALAADAPGRSAVQGWRWAVAGPLALIVVAGVLWPAAGPRGELIHQERSLFGVLRVFESGEESNRHRRLFSGSTLHGLQFLNPAGRRLSSSYHGRATTIGIVLSERDGGTPLRIGVIGLGVGTLTACGREGDTFRYYEIDPAMVRIAGDSGHFSFLEEARAKLEIVVGDGRLAIADEQLRGGSRGPEVPPRGSRRCRRAPVR